MQYDMKDEKRPPTLLPEGHRAVRIVEMILGKSKNDNEMFTTTIEDIKTRKSMPIFLITTPKKRWMLKSLLQACQVPAAADGIYDFEVTDIIGKTVIAVIEHVDEEYINRNGETVKAAKAKVTEFLPAELTAGGEVVAWNE